MSYIFDAYRSVDDAKSDFSSRRNGVLVSQENGAVVAYALWKLQESGCLFVNHNDLIYEGMIIGIHSRENDLVVNLARRKQLTNICAAGIMTGRYV